MPGNNPITGDLSWPSLSSSVPLLLSALALSLPVSLATAFFWGKSGVSLCLSSLCGHTCYLFHSCLHYLVPLSISFCLSALTLICRTPLHASNSFFVSFALHVLGWFLPVRAWTTGRCLPSGLSCLIAWSLWGSVKVKEILSGGQWFSSSSTVTGLLHSLHGFFQFSLSLLLAYFPPATIFPSAPGSSGSMKGRRKKE